MRVRYWHLNIQETLESKYPLDKINHWEIKCICGEYQHFGVYWFKYGTPVDKEPVHGICCYYNEIDQTTLKKLTEYITKRFGGKILHRQSRVFFNGSKVIFDPISIGTLANDLSLQFNFPVEITIELEKVLNDEITDNKFNFPPKKALPIVGID
jgi:hypothetical protein